jgi:hypothetical protein
MVPGSHVAPSLDLFKMAKGEKIQVTGPVPAAVIPMHLGPKAIDLPALYRAPR